jgi:hypothetical protein
MLLHVKFQNIEVLAGGHMKGEQMAHKVLSSELS